MTREDLKNLKPEYEFFIGIDSDGCVFPSMELKHKECFIPNIIKHWKLQGISKYAREAAEFVNLYSQWRGENRFPALLRVFDLLKDHPAVRRSSAKIPEVPALRRWAAEASSLGNPTLKQAIDKNPDPDLIQTLKWSEAVNTTVLEIVTDVPPFPGVRETLEKMVRKADVIVVSGTPGEALQREWAEHDIAKYVRLIAGQELGKKREHLSLAAGGKYAPEKMLMIGDAPGDMQAARSVGAQFYPIFPGSEEESWDRLLNEALECFFSGRYSGEFENNLVEEFNRLLPDTPPWKRLVNR
ncbi:MAG: HAD family hydrolase [Spirochaetaceae bacterium]|nr:MAG: HAD family hydrolase [Spirochaetaceae bacterium]